MTGVIPGLVRRQLRGMMISMAARVKASRAVLATTLREERKTLKERLLPIMKYKPPRRFNLVVSVLIFSLGRAGRVCSTATDPSVTYLISFVLHSFLTSSVAISY